MTESRTPQRPRSHVVVMVVNLFIAATLIVAGVLVVWANNKVGDRLVVSIDGGTTSATTPDGAPAEDWDYDTSNLRAKNFLLTGSDNGACPDKGDGTSGGIGERESFGERSDTIMVLRVDPTVNDVVVLSFPRDLWVKIAGTTREARINSAFDSKDPSRLIRTIADNFDVPIDHYVNVNLCAFKEIVDSVGGVKVPFAYRTKDERVGLREVGLARVDDADDLGEERIDGRIAHPLELTDGDRREHAFIEGTVGDRAQRPGGRGGVGDQGGQGIPPLRRRVRRVARDEPTRGVGDHDVDAVGLCLVDGIEDHRTAEGHGMLRVWMSAPRPLSDAKMMSLRGISGSNLSMDACTASI